MFLNPPYGRELGHWIEKACESAQEGATVVCLLPARTDTRWFHRFALPFASELRFFRGRIRFAGATHSAPFPSVLVVFRPSQTRRAPGVAPLRVTSVSAAAPSGHAGQQAATLTRAAPETTKAAFP